MLSLSLLMLLSFIGFVQTINRGYDFLDEMKTPDWLKIILGIVAYLLFCFIAGGAGDYLRNS